MTNFVLTAEFNLLDGTVISGHVTTKDSIVYQFNNTSSSLDLFFKLRKTAGNWHITEAAEGFVVPTEIIESVGNQIDNFNANAARLEI